MVAPKVIEQAIKHVTDQESFIQRLLVGALEWEIPDGIQGIPDISVGWSQEELRARGLDVQLVDGQAWQIQALKHGQPWGIFLLEFDSPAHFTARGGLYGATGTLRQVLRGLVPSRKRDPHLPEWRRDNLLFICTHDYTQFRFAYFKAPKDARQVAPLASFGWNKGDTHLRTLCEYNLPALAFPEDRGADPDAWVRQWAGAFDKTRVTEQFYKDYVRALDLMEKSLIGLNDSEEQPAARRNYAQLILGRLMFLYFLQKKGWLGVAGQTTASGGRLQPDYDYLGNHFRRVARARPGKKTRGFYEFLTGLFFDVLNVPRTQRPASITRTYGEVPFLNGGLFHRTAEELYDRERLGLPDDVFGTLFDGPDALFVKYNFTVKEDEPLDVTVAVDPEMLGLVFERQVAERQMKGAFYTPLSVVGFMCERALAEHLASAGVLPHAKAAALLETESADALSAAEARAVSKGLWEATVCDAAVGSGAFLIGMLHRLVRLQYTLYAAFPEIADNLRKQLAGVNWALPRLKVEATESQVKFQLKRALIQNSLFGVDIEPSAIQIAQLRMWLSLAVEHEAEFVHDIPPLPNLDHNLRLGNSLVSHYLGIDFEMEADTRSERLRDILDQLDKREADYYELSDERQKEQQRQDIDLLHWRLLEEGIQDELRGLPRRRAAIEKALEKRRREALFPDLMDYTAAERAELNWLERREPELRDGLAKLRAGQADLRKEEQTTHPVLWKVHFARVFRRGGFDIVILNPPYVSTQGASDLGYVPALSAKLGFNDDLYVFFTFRAFGLPERHYTGIARSGGVVCYITSDTYFTLATKTRMRQLLQAKDLRLLAQCDPFRQTVDTAIFLNHRA